MSFAKYFCRSQSRITCDWCTRDVENDLVAEVTIRLARTAKDGLEIVAKVVKVPPAGTLCVKAVATSENTTDF